jgi:predicted nuclease of predicted toxin-antitoxin system
MRLLLDENLSESLVSRIAGTFPDISHVRKAIGTGATDLMIWEHARRTGAAIVTLDEDFQTLSMVRGAPPKVVWIDGHNPRTRDVAQLLIERHGRIASFLADADTALLVLTLPRRT